MNSDGVNSDGVNSDRVIRDRANSGRANSAWATISAGATISARVNEEQGAPDA
ncbi:hypothetical protein AB0E81_14380 [Streptomyces sp. NPDC033538]|uniref:hypothetical protein n=1 Tax=Streptomyces sp. NPDC033538 TaxID=3155367 RepID=UPI0034035054